MRSFGDEILVYHNAQEGHWEMGRQGGHLNANLSEAETERRRGSPLRDLRAVVVLTFSLTLTRPRIRQVVFYLTRHHRLHSLPRPPALIPLHRSFANHFPDQITHPSAKEREGIGRSYKSCAKSFGWRDCIAGVQHEQR